MALDDFLAVELGPAVTNHKNPDDVGVYVGFNFFSHSVGGGSVTTGFYARKSP